MTVSSNRIRFLDDETSLVVTDFSNIRENKPISNVYTPETPEEMEAISLALENLRHLQGAIGSLLRGINDGSIGQVFIGTLMNTLLGSVLNYPHLATFLNTLRNSNPVAFRGVINRIMDKTATNIYRNPHLITSSGNTVREQILALAIRDLSQDVLNNQITPDYINALVNYGTNDPYQIKPAVDKAVSEYRYVSRDEEKYLLPSTRNTADLVLCHMGVSLAYYNYLYSTIKLENISDVAISYANSILSGSEVNEIILSNFKNNLTSGILDRESVFYYGEEFTRHMYKEFFSRLKSPGVLSDPETTRKYFTAIKRLTIILSKHIKDSVTNKATLNNSGSQSLLYVSRIINQIKTGSLVLDNTLSLTEYQDVSESVLTDYERLLRESVREYYTVTKQSNDNILNVFLLVDSLNVIISKALDESSLMTILQKQTLFSVLENITSKNLYLVDGSYLADIMDIRRIQPIIVYEKMTVRALFTALLKYLRVLNNQTEPYYKRDNSLGLIGAIVDKINTLRVDLVKNSTLVQTLVNNPNSDFIDTFNVMTNSSLNLYLHPVSFNIYDLDVYRKHGRKLSRFLFYPDRVEVKYD